MSYQISMVVKYRLVTHKDEFDYENNRWRVCDSLEQAFQKAKDNKKYLTNDKERIEIGLFYYDQNDKIIDYTTYYIIKRYSYSRLRVNEETKDNSWATKVYAEKTKKGIKIMPI